MPGVADDVLIVRVNNLHRALETHHLSKRGLAFTEARFNLSRSRTTVSLVEGRLKNGSTVTIITTNDTTYYRYLMENPEAFLEAGEVAGSRPTFVYGPLEEGRATQRIHAEQLGVNDAKATGAIGGRVASSNRGCDKLCVSILREEFPTFRHLNPEIPGTQPPPIPEPSEASKAARAISDESRLAGAEGPARRGTSRAARGVADDLAEASASRGAARPIAHESAESAAAGAKAFVNAERTTLRSLLRAAVTLEALLATLSAITFVLDVVLLVISLREEKRRQKAIEETIKTKLAGWLHATLIFEGEKITRVFLNKWNRPSELILYASPLLEIRTNNGTDYRVEFNRTASLLERAVSRKLIETEEEERAVDYWQLRFSIPYPLFTPFDAYLAYVEVVGEYFIAGWLSAAQRKKVNSKTAQLLVDVAMHLSTVAALLKIDDVAGFEGREFKADTAVAERQSAILEIALLVDEKLSPRLRQLEKLGILDPNEIVVSRISSGIRGRVQQLLTGDQRLSRYMNILANDLSSISGNALGYQRRDAISDTDRLAAKSLAYRDEFFAQLTEDIREYLPKDRQPVPRVRQGMQTGDILLIPPQ